MCNKDLSPIEKFLMLNKYIKEFYKYLDRSDLTDGEIVHINKNSSFYSQELYFSLKTNVQVSIWFEKIKENTILKFAIPNKWEKDSLIEYSISDPTQIEENTKIILKEILLIL